MQRRRAFTLIELLVVITIIIALLAILIPSMGRALAAAEATTCASNLKQVGAGAMSYSVDSLGALPHTMTFASALGGNWDHWYKPIGSTNTGIRDGQLYPYLDSEDVFVCPTFPSTVGTAMPAGNRVVNTYAMFEAVNNNWQGVRIERFSDEEASRAGQQLYITEEAPYLHAASKFILNNTAMGISADPNPATYIDSPATYHVTDDPTLQTGNGSVLFLDLHVELVAIDDPSDAKRLGFPGRGF